MSLTILSFLLKMSILSREQLLSAPRSGAPFFPPADPEVERKAAYQAQFEKSLRGVANSLVVYLQHSKEGKIDLYRYHFSPGAYQYKGEWLKPYLEQLIGPRAEAVAIIQRAFENAFPGFKSIRVIEIKEYDWNYTVEIDMN